MSYFLRVSFSVLFSLLMSSEWLHANRVAAKTETAGCVIESDAMRGRCPGVNQRMKDQGCITEEERKTLDEKKWGALCDGKDLVAMCGCSCFDPSVRVWVEEIKTGQVNWVALRDLLNTSEQYRIRVLSENNVANETFLFETLPFEITACDFAEVLSLEMTDGSVLKVTAEHPVWLASGEMVQARNLVSGEKLKNYLGEEIGIESITVEMSSAEVLNILVDESVSQIPHVIVAEGLLVGDAEWQRTLLQGSL